MYSKAILFSQLLLQQVACAACLDAIIVKDNVITRASPTLSGIGIEDANHQLYGGLYAQMVFGESFEEPSGPDGASGSAPWILPAQDGYFKTSQGPTWKTVRGLPKVTSTDAFSGEQSQMLPVGAAVENSGLLGAGLFFQAGRRYEGSVYVRAPVEGEASLTIGAIVDGSGAGEFVTQQKWTSDWKRVKFTLVPTVSSACPLSLSSPNHTSTCNEADKLTGCIDGCVASPELGDRCVVCNGLLRLSVQGRVGLEVDQVTLMPAEWGLFKDLPVRKDLAELMLGSNENGMQISVMRLGGSMILCNGYRWKNFRGPREQRQPYKGVWYRYDTSGWKIFEFLDLCEAADMQACVVTLNINEHVTDLEDLVEYAFGPATSKWGGLRVKDGRAQPYRPFLIELGNENPLNFTGEEPNPCRDSCRNFTRRWSERALAMDAKAQLFGLNLTFIVGFDAQQSTSCTQESIRASETSIRFLARLAAGLRERAVWDCHIGGDSPADGNVTGTALSELQQILRSEGSLMRVAVLEENGVTHNMLRMVGHVTQNHALSRLGQFVTVNTVATGLQPLGRNSNGWDQGNIFFTPKDSWLAPPAVATRMISSVSRGLSEVLEVAGQPWALDVLASRRPDGTKMGLRVVNPSNVSAHATLTVEGWTEGSVSVETLADDSPLAVHVDSVSQKTSWLSLSAEGWTFPPYSFTTFVGVRQEPLWV